jgi:putative SOS response-associated peptidase YedK
MCGRYALSKLPAELIEEFEIHTGKTMPILPADWNIAPTKPIYIILGAKRFPKRSSHSRLQLMHALRP